MRLRFVHDAKGRGEEIAALVAVAATALGVAWLRTGLPTPRCVFHALTGAPCLTCGTTRSLRCLLDGDIAGAMAWNPLALVGMAAVAAFTVYVALIALFRFPRVRVCDFSPRDARCIRALVAAALVANWVYLGFRFSGAG